MNPLVTTNPITSVNPNNQTNPMMQLISALQNGADPKQLVNNIMQSDPTVMQRFQQMRQECGNQDPKQFIFNYCQRNSIDPTPITQVANMMGLR